MINLGQNWGVKDSGLLAYKQVGSKYFNKDFDFTRASNGTYVDKDGVLQTAELYNLLDYSQDFSQWFKLSTTGLTNGYSAPNGQNQAYSIEHTGTVGQYYVSDTTVNLPSAIVNYSVYVKKGTKNWVALRVGNICIQYFDIENFVLGNYTFAPPLSYNFEEVGNGWVRLSMTVLGNGASNSISVYVVENGTTINPVGSDGDKLIYIYGAQVVEGTEPLDYQYTNGRVGIPRIDFSDGVGALLLEPQTTQLLPYSEDFSRYDIVGDITREGGYLAPDGTYTAYKITKIGSGGAIYDGSLGSATAARSIYAKSVSGTGTAQLLSHNSNTNNTFTLTEEWQRFELNSETSGIGSGTFYAVDFRGGGTLDEIIIWGANATDNQTYATSYIKTEGSSVTRIADVANNCGSEQDFNSEEGVLYAEIAALIDDLSFRYISLSDGTGDNCIRLYYTIASNSITYQVRFGGSLEVLNQIAITDIKEFNKIAVKYKENDFSFWINGVEVATDTSGNTPIGLNVLQFSDANGTSSPFYGKVRSVKYFPEALTDEQLEALTK